MRVLVVTHYFWPETFRINDLVQELGRRGHQVTVLTQPPNYPEGEVFPDFRRNPGRYRHYEGAEIIHVPVTQRGKTRLTLALNYLSTMCSQAFIGAWRLRGRPFDVVLVFQPSPFTTCYAGILLGKVKRAPVLMWVLDLWPDMLSAIGVVRQPWLLSVIGFFVSLGYRGCDLVLAQSRAFMTAIGRASGDDSRVRYFPGWAEPLFNGNLGSVTPAPEVREYEHTFNVMFAGNIGESQDFPAVLEAAEALRDRPDIRWLVVGDGRMGDWVRTEIGRRGLGERVKMLGRHPIDRMPSFFRAASLLLVSLKDDPVYEKTIPGRVQAFLASGIPIVGMLNGEGARVIEQAEAGLTCPAGDGRGLADRIVQLAARSSEERSAMGARGAAFAQREFDRDRLLGQLEQWMSEQAGEASQGRRSPRSGAPPRPPAVDGGPGGA